MEHKALILTTAVTSSFFILNWTPDVRVIAPFTWLSRASMVPSSNYWKEVNITEESIAYIAGKFRLSVSLDDSYV